MFFMRLVLFHIVPIQPSKTSVQTGEGDSFRWWCSLTPRWMIRSVSVISATSVESSSLWPTPKDCVGKWTRKTIKSTWLDWLRCLHQNLTVHSQSAVLRLRRGVWSLGPGWRAAWVSFHSQSPKGKVILSKPAPPSRGFDGLFLLIMFNSLLEKKTHFTCSALFWFNWSQNVFCV